MKTVWVNGTFDVLHIGHIKLFEFAKSQGDYLIVGINSDDYIKRLKGSSRPINNQQNRLEFLQAIKYIDEVCIFNNEEELNSILKRINPDIIVWGDEYKDKIKIGAEYGKKLIYFKKIEGYSSSNIINKIKEER